MYRGLKVGAVVPARDEERNIGPVVRDLLALAGDGCRRTIDDLVVCDNGSRDQTALRAQEAGARVVHQERPGYGIACLTALAALAPVDVVLFTDGDGSFDAVQAGRLLVAVAGGADLAIGSRVQGAAEPGALSLPQVAGNRVAALLIRLLWRERISDLGPYRAIRSAALRRISMKDRAYGWTVEMQIKAMQHGLKVVETPVDTRKRRYGRSKVGGTVRGVVGASAGILGVIARLWVEEKTRTRRTGRRKEAGRT